MELFTNRHLSDQALRALLDGMLDDLQTLETAEHLADCEACAGRLATLAAQPASVREAPRGMLEQIQSRLRDLDRDERIRRQARARQREFLRYCVSMTAGIAAVVTLLFVAPVSLDAKMIAEPVQPVLPESTPVELPEPLKITLPEPKTDEDRETLREKFSEYIKIIFGEHESA